jgi:hypothetical protein
MSYLTQGSDSMSLTRRPISVTGVAWLLIVVGIAMFLRRSRELGNLEQDAFLIEFTELLAVVAGAFMLRRQNWARWLALAWVGFHVILAAFPPFHGLVVHVLILAGIAYLLLRSDAAEYFRGTRGAAS